MARIREIRTRSLEPGQDLKNCNIIEIRAFKTLIQSLLPANHEIKLKFESDGIRAGSSDDFFGLMADAYLPKDQFIKYKELGEFGLHQADKFEGWLANRLGQKFSGKKNIHLALEPANDESSADQLQVKSAQSTCTIPLGSPEFYDKCNRPQSIVACQVLISGKDLVDALKSAKHIDKKVKFLVSGQSLRIVAHKESGEGFIGKPPCTILEDGSADSRFLINQFQEIGKMAQKCKEIKLSLGLHQPLIMEMKVDGVLIKYYIPEESECKS
jgi:hypothetical protein